MIWQAVVVGLYLFGCTSAMLLGYSSGQRKVLLAIKPLLGSTSPHEQAFVRAVLKATSPPRWWLWMRHVSLPEIPAPIPDCNGCCDYGFIDRETRGYVLLHSCGKDKEIGGPVAQMVEAPAVDPDDEGSIPSRSSNPRGVH